MMRNLTLACWLAAWSSPAAAQALQFHYPAPAADAFTVARDVQYGTSEGTALRMDVYRPRGGGPVPALIFFNRAVGDVYYTVAPTPGGIGETPVGVDPADGTLRTQAGETIDAPYALLDGSISPDGDLVASDLPLGVSLWRLAGPLSSTTTLTGIYPNDTWSGGHVTWTRRHCRGGELDVGLHSDPNLVGDELTDVLATVRGRPAARIVVPPVGAVQLRVPLTAVDGTCTVDFLVTPTRIPAKRVEGSTDVRNLGVHFDTFVYNRPA